MRGEQLVQFKLQLWPPENRWEDITPIVTAWLGTEYEADHLALYLSGFYQSECRWNWHGSTQGHYVQHPKLLIKLRKEFLYDPQK